MDSPSILGSAVTATDASAARPRKRRTRADEIGHVLVGEGVAEREHRHRMAHLAEGLDGCGADPPRRAVGAHQLGKARLDRRIALAQRVVVGVGDLRRVLGVVELVVVRDLARQPLELGRRLRLGQLVGELSSTGSWPSWRQACIGARAKCQRPISADVHSRLLRALLRQADRRASRCRPSARREPASSAPAGPRATAGPARAWQAPSPASSAGRRRASAP